METFRWIHQKEFTTTISPRVKTIKFGDGYEQRYADGLNHDLRSYSLTFKVKREDYSSFNQFLTCHGGYKAFKWLDPDTYREITVKCSSWTSSTNGTVVTVTATFEEVVA